MCNIFHASILKCEPAGLPVGSWFGGKEGSTSSTHHYCSVFKSGAVQLESISVSSLLTAATEVGLC